MYEETICCSSCCCEITNGAYHTVEGEILCDDCLDDETFECECCHDVFLKENDYGDDNIKLCKSCFNREYHTCCNCERVIHDDETFWSSDYPYCSRCYDDNDEYDDNGMEYIYDYSYKPTPKFKHCKGENVKLIRYYGVELEIDDGGYSDDNAEDILNAANAYSYEEDHLYIKTDGSLNEGMELVSHPCSILYHRTVFPWKDIINQARNLGYVSHDTDTCGLHVHISRNKLGENEEAQEETIGKLMFFFESHWNELVKFSRRTERALEKWAARYGYKDKPKDILDDAKKSSKGRYASVNICNTKTVEIRMFRGTLKYNTFMATLEMVDAICENVIRLSEDELRSQSWSDFVACINPAYIELIRYLKERQLYINEPVVEEAEV